MRTFILINRLVGNGEDNIHALEWWEREKDGMLYNQAGGWNCLISTDTIIEKVQAKSWAELLTKENIQKTHENTKGI